MAELFTNLGIDWKLLIAQLVNFGILVYVLKRFVYAPIIAVLEKRRKDITDTSLKSEQADQRLQEIEKEKERVLKEARVEASGIISKAENIAKKQSEDIVNQAKQKAEAALNEGKESLDREREVLKNEVKNEIGEIVALAVEKTVGDFINKDAEEKLKAEALRIIKDNAKKI